ncbi:UBX domain-containing protein [Seiridium cupressi]
MDEDVAQFMAITGVDSEEVARGYLEISSNDQMQAIQLFFESPELAANFTANTNANPAQSSSAPARPPQGSSTGYTGREDSRGIITIDSDEEEDDVDMVGGDNDVTAVARAAQEEDDAAMARRLQEEMYGQGGGPAAAEEVRAPMSRTTETLVGPDMSWTLEDDRDSVLLEQLRRRRQPPSQPRNPFSQSLWEEPIAPGIGAPPVPMGSRPGPPPAGGRSQRLADMFRPPYDLISQLPWEDARQEGKDEKKWIIVNVQDSSDFNCQTLNRDHWKDENIKALIKEHFIFMQFDKDNPRGQEYLGFYFSQYENASNYPYVAIIDPRTGEQVKLWSGLPFPGKGEFYSDLIEFLDRYSLAANSKNPVPKTKPKAKKLDVDRMTEEEMLEMALQNSMENGGPSKASEEDPDALTKSVPDLTKGKETADTAQEPALESPFSQIPSDRPHVEPENNPASTTRIQFRHPAGRVIRRFSTSDPVRRIYEWLKAEPLDGKDGVVFELKAQPGGDLIDKLDATVEQSGLKNGTIMIEFIEDE